MGKKTQEKSVAFLNEIHGITRQRHCKTTALLNMERKADFPVRQRRRPVIGNARKNLIRCCGNSSFPANPIKMFSLKIISSTGLKKCFQKELKRQQEWLGHTPYMT